MSNINRRHFLLSGALAAALGGLPASIARALDAPARVTTGTIMDVEHVVILMQENRSFDHYFGTLSGVRGFSDRFPIPTVNGTVWSQPDEHDAKHMLAPFKLNTTQHFEHMRVTGTPHTFPDAQKAWDNGRMSDWPDAKHNHSLGYFTRDDLPFQFALAEAFTICDAYHCSIHAGTDPNRIFHWTGTNDPSGVHHGPVITNQYDTIGADPGGHGGYTWTTYPERLSAAGITWQTYQKAHDNFDDNPLVGFKLFRMANKAKDGPLADLANRSLRTRDLDLLKADVLAGSLPQVSWIIAPDVGSEHPGPSSPAQGADYTSRVLDALTANPEVWAKTVFIVNFDENDGFFDHVAPPAPPSKHGPMTFGDSQVDTTGEYHTVGKDDYIERPYGLGPRVPMYAISPWSKGGFVNSQVFDHTSVIRFLETRFGVKEPNISQWRRAVCGDLTSCFDFATPNREDFFQHLPATRDLADRAHALGGTTTPPTPARIEIPLQDKGQRPMRPLPYDLAATARYDGNTQYIDLENRSRDVAVVFHVYDGAGGVPFRHTVQPGGKVTNTSVPLGDGQGTGTLVLAPGGFHRLYFGSLSVPAVIHLNGDKIIVDNSGDEELVLTWTDQAYGAPSQTVRVPGKGTQSLALDLAASQGWYDFSIGNAVFTQRLAGHVASDGPLFSDPALGGPAIMAPWKPAVV